jgi:hypothetical protein
MIPITTASFSVREIIDESYKYDINITEGTWAKRMRRPYSIFVFIPKSKINMEEKTIKTSSAMKKARI